MTNNREDYLKCIFQYEEMNTSVTNKLLSETLNIARASVSQMISKLVKSNLVTNVDSFITLTDNGRNMAKELVSKHRLWEAFLLQHLNYAWDEVHDDAELLEHATSPILLQRLNAYLNYPTHCPHGGRIYVNSITEESDYIKLVQLHVDDSVIVKRLKEEDSLLKLLKDNIELNDEITIIDKTDNIIIVSKDNQQVHIPIHLAEYIYTAKK